MNAAEVLVTGGTGLLGSRVAERLRVAGRGVRILSRSGGDGRVRGDLGTGEGLETAVRGVETVVHCASSPLRKTRQVDVEGTGRLLEEAVRAGVSHVVFISIVGVDRNPYYPYYRYKLDAERVIERAGVPWTILRATQFHEFALGFVRMSSRGPVALAPRGFLGQPVDVSEVAARLAGLALSEPAGHVTDFGGPEVGTFAELSRAYLEATGRRKKVLEIPVPGRTARAWREGAQICLDGERGTISWEEFLRGRLAKRGS